MDIPKTLLQAAVAGLALASTAACEKVDVPVERHTAECIDGCVSPAAHLMYAGEYDCPPCGMG